MLSKIPSWITGPILAMIGILGLIWLLGHQYDKGNSDGQTTGYARAVADQEVANAKAELKRQQYKEDVERESTFRIEEITKDVDKSKRANDRLQRQLDKIRQLADQYSGPQSPSEAKRSTIDLLTDVLSKSVKRNTELAEYADRSSTEGRTCEKQYDTLRKK